MNEDALLATATDTGVAVDFHDGFESLKRVTTRQRAIPVLRAMQRAHRHRLSRSARLSATTFSAAAHTAMLHSLAAADLA